MNTQRNLMILLVLCSTLILRGDGCNIFEQRDIQQVIGLPVPAEWVTDGYTDANYEDMQTVNIAADVRDALADYDVSAIVSLNVAGVQYEVLESTGHDAQRSGAVQIDGSPVMTFDVPSNATGVSGAAGDGSGTVTMQPAGTLLVNTRLNAWLDQYQADPASADDNLLEFTYHVEWSSNPAPTAADPDNFTWTTDLVLQMVGTVTINED
jgi:hypothetical protein